MSRLGHKKAGNLMIRLPAFEFISRRSLAKVLGESREPFSKKVLWSPKGPSVDSPKGRRRHSSKETSQRQADLRWTW